MKEQQVRQVRQIVLSVLREALVGTVRNEPEKTPDGDEWNNYVFDGDDFRTNVNRLLDECLEACEESEAEATGAESPPTPDDSCSRRVAKYRAGLTPR